MKKSLINWLGLLGPISFLSYVAAMIFAPLAYPGYQWMQQAVSDLSAVNAPSKMLWSQLAALYDIGGIVCITVICIYIQGKLTKTLRTGIYLFAVMNWISSVGYQCFPLAHANEISGFQDIMHLVVTVFVVLLSIISMVVIIVGGTKEKRYRALAIWALLTLILMMMGAVGTNAVPRDYFGIVERFSVLAVTGFKAVLGIYMFGDLVEDEK